MSANKTLLKQLEDKLLHELSSASGEILDNSSLIETLENTKSKAAEIEAKLRQAEQMTEELESARQEYKQAAKRGSILFFVISGLTSLNSMYQYSLWSYLEVFKLTLSTSKRDASIERRVYNIVEGLTYDVYNYTCLGLFEKHKLLLRCDIYQFYLDEKDENSKLSMLPPFLYNVISFQMALKILEGDGELDHEYLDFFIKGSVSLEHSDRSKPYSWVPELGWEDMMRLDSLKGSESKLAGIANSVENNEVSWREWYGAKKPEEAPLPDGYEQSVSMLEKMLVLRCLRQDRITIAVTRFVMQTLGEKYVSPPVIDYNHILKSSRCAVKSQGEYSLFLNGG
jgi:dynein heavy chain